MTQSIRKQKKLLRNKLRSLRRSLNPQQHKSLSLHVLDNLYSLDIISKAKHIFTYISFDNEVYTHSLIEKFLQNHQVVTVPRITGPHTMIPVKINSFQDLALDRYKILAPISEQTYLEPIDICITPGLAFTHSGKRLGMGGGYYDNFFSQYNVKTRIALAFDFQLLDSLPSENHDHLVDFIITPTQVINSHDTIHS